MLKPKGYFVVGGVGISQNSPLNAFDNALRDAGIADYNFVPVSSIIPPEAIEVPPQEFEKGCIIYGVLARCQGTSGERCTAGVAWGRASDESIGVVMEYSGINEETHKIKKELTRRVREMAAIRGIRIEEIRNHIEVLEVPEDSYGCTISCLVFTNYL